MLIEVYTIFWENILYEKKYQQQTWIHTNSFGYSANGAAKWRVYARFEDIEIAGKVHGNNLNQNF